MTTPVTAPAAEKSGRKELIPMWAAQSANLTHHTHATELLDALVSGVTALIDATFSSQG